MTLREQFEKEYSWVEKKEQPMFMSVKYIHWLEAKIEQLQKTGLNSDCSKCPCCDAPWNIRENDSCSCGAFIAKRS